MIFVGFSELHRTIKSISNDLTFDKSLTTFVITPLHTNLYRENLNLRKTKTDKVDAHTIASMRLKAGSNTSHDICPMHFFQSSQGQGLLHPPILPIGTT